MVILVCLYKLSVAVSEPLGGYSAWALGIVGKAVPVV